MKKQIGFPTIQLDAERLAFLVSVCVAACEEALAAMGPAPRGWTDQTRPSHSGVPSSDLAGTGEPTTLATGIGAQPSPSKLLLTVEEASKRLSIGRPKMYELIMRGEVRSIKIGASRRVPVDALEDYVRQGSAPTVAATGLYNAAHRGNRLDSRGREEAR